MKNTENYKAAQISYSMLSAEVGQKWKIWAEDHVKWETEVLLTRKGSGMLAFADIQI